MSAFIVKFNRYGYSVVCENSRAVIRVKQRLRSQGYKHVDNCTITKFSTMEEATTRANNGDSVKNGK
jgi:hypothetical protein